ncbi:hypothetical protein VIGAN_10215400 [Vigna angularis var. angularis]|uniref:Uncharacterized protein n=1 Tax=Vigna angularis var. angularis TaxID=157739 RepID=A0A0S3T654_PHAAN|nr:hypothetical protein VIGAN_10215400 [Vigna angularis var. angularis]
MEAMKVLHDRFMMMEKIKIEMVKEVENMHINMETKRMKYFRKVGKSGFGVYKFRLSRIEGQAEMGSVILKEARNIRRGEMESNIVRFLSADMSS